MKAPRRRFRTRRPLFLLPALAALLGSASTASAAFVVHEGFGLFTPSFRGNSGTTYFGWSNGSWDGNPPPAVGEPDPSPDIINGTPSINPGGLPGSAFITQGTSIDLVSGSNNIYSSVGVINSANLQLHIPTAGTGGDEGFTTIIIQGSGLSGTMFGFSGALDGFGFGDIDGILPEYVITRNQSGTAQWWAKWELPGSQTSYTVDIIGKYGSHGGSVLSVTDLRVDTLFSNSGFASDSAIVPEPSAALLGLLGAAVLLRRRRR